MRVEGPGFPGDPQRGEGVFDAVKQSPQRRSAVHSGPENMQVVAGGKFAETGDLQREGRYGNFRGQQRRLDPRQQVRGNFTDEFQGQVDIVDFSPADGIGDFLERQQFSGDVFPGRFIQFDTDKSSH